MKKINIVWHAILIVTISSGFKKDTEKHVSEKNTFKILFDHAG